MLVVSLYVHTLSTMKSQEFLKTLNLEASNVYITTRYVEAREMINVIRVS